MDCKIRSSRLASKITEVILTGLYFQQMREELSVSEFCSYFIAKLNEALRQQSKLSVRKLIISFAKTQKVYGKLLFEKPVAM